MSGSGTQHTDTARAEELARHIIERERAWRDDQNFEPGLRDGHKRPSSTALDLAHATLAALASLLSRLAATEQERDEARMETRDFKQAHALVVEGKKAAESALAVCEAERTRLREAIEQARSPLNQAIGYATTAENHQWGHGMTDRIEAIYENLMASLALVSAEGENEQR